MDPASMIRWPGGRLRTQAVTAAPDKPYDWKESFAAYKVGKVPRMPDGKPNLQGIWSRAQLRA